MESYGEPFTYALNFPHYAWFIGPCFFSKLREKKNNFNFFFCWINVIWLLSFSFQMMKWISFIWIHLYSFNFLWYFLYSQSMCLVFTHFPCNYERRRQLISETPTQTVERFQIVSNNLKCEIRMSTSNNSNRYDSILLDGTCDATNIFCSERNFVMLNQVHCQLSEIGCALFTSRNCIGVDSRSLFVKFHSK